MKELREYLCYCGLYCKMCSLVNGMPQEAKHLYNTMKRDGWEFFGKYEYPEFEVFWKVLDSLQHKDDTCVLCQGGCGDPSCEIRKCAKEKKVDCVPIAIHSPAKNLSPLLRTILSFWIITDASAKSVLRPGF